MDEQATRRAFEGARAKLEAFGLESNELIDKILDLPSGPVLTRKSGASGAEPAKYFTDMTFQEAMQLRWTQEDPRSTLAVILEQVQDTISYAESRGLKSEKL